MCLRWRCGAGEASDRSWAARAGAGRWMPSFPARGAGHDAPPNCQQQLCIAVARRSWIAHCSREPTFWSSVVATCMRCHQRYVCLLGLSKWTGPKVSCPVGALVHRGRAGSFDVGHTDWESCHTRPRLSLLQPFAGVARSPFVEAGGFPLEGRVNVALVMRRLEPKLPGRLVSRRLTVS